MMVIFSKKLKQLLSLPKENDQASFVAQMVMNMPTMQETWVRSQSQEDPWEKGMATHSSILVWRILQTEEPGGLWSIGSQRVGYD